MRATASCWLAKFAEFGNQQLVVCIFCPEFALSVADQLDLAREKRIRDGPLDPVNSELKRRRAAVQGKYC